MSVACIATCALLCAPNQPASSNRSRRRDLTVASGPRSLRREKSANGGDRGGRLLLHQPVAGIRDHQFGHGDGGVAHHDRLVGTKGLLATDREDWHGELRGHRRHVFLSILPDGAKLSESRMHRAWQGVELSIVLPRRLVDLRRIAGELIPETVEIDTLTSRHETLHVRPAEI